MIDIDVDGVTYPVPSSAADTNWAAKQVAFEQAVVTYIDDTATDLAELDTAWSSVTWSALTLQNSWANVTGSVAASALLPNGVVMVRAFIETGSAPSIAFTLASGRRPPFPMQFLCSLQDGDDLCKVSVATNGEVTVGPSYLSAASPSDGVHIGFSFSIAANP